MGKFAPESVHPGSGALALTFVLRYRQHAEEDYSNCLHLQSILPPATSQKLRPTGAISSTLSTADGIVEERGRTVIASGSVGDLAVETAVSAGDDVFLLEVIF
jgi:hypothetical protein